MNRTHPKENKSNCTMRLSALLLTIATLCVPVYGTSKDAAHAAASTLSGHDQMHEAQSASLFSTIAQHHGYPYGWNLPIQGLVHEHEAVEVSNVKKSPKKDSHRTNDHHDPTLHGHWGLPCTEHVEDCEEALDGLE